MVKNRKAVRRIVQVRFLLSEIAKRTGRAPQTCNRRLLKLDLIPEQSDAGIRDNRVHYLWTLEQVKKLEADFKQRPPKRGRYQS